MYTKKFEPFENKVRLALFTMYGEELKCVTEAYETNSGTKDNRGNRISGVIAVIF